MYLFLHDYTIILCHQWCLSKNQPLVNKIWKESVVFFLFWIDMDSQHYCLLVGFKCVCVRMRGCGCMRVCVHVHPAHAVFWHHSTFTRILFLLSDIVKISCLCTVPCVNHILISSFLSPPPRMKGGGVLESLCLSIHLSVCVSNHVHSVSPELLNQFFTKFGMVMNYHEGNLSSRKIGSPSWMSRSQQGLI